MEKFIDINKEFWKRYEEPDTGDVLLAEVNEHPVVNHSNAITAKIIAKAKNLRIAWLKDGKVDEGLMKSYSKNSVFIEFKNINKIMKIIFFIKAIFYYIYYVLLGDRIDRFEYKGIPYGDFVYDTYLSVYSKATFYRFDTGIIKVFYSLLLRDSQAREILRRNSNIKAILVSHYVGLKSGVLSRVCMKKGIPVYCKAGGQGICVISLLKKLEDRYDFPRKPSREELDLLSGRLRERVESDFEEFIKPTNDRYFQVFQAAYDKKLSSSTNRQDFLKRFELEDKPNIFVMLHAFNDYPKSYSKNLIFKDYYKWFIETYEFAVKDPSKNWIFKEHPENRFYKANDVDLGGMMKDLPGHIKFLSADSDIKASTVLNVADLIVTCIGTAGVEMPALRGIPSLIAGDSFYDGFGFTIEPKTKEEYFNILKDFKPYLLSPEQRLRAKSCYLYNNRYSLVSFAAGAPTNSEETLTNSKKLQEEYPKRIMNIYKEKADMVYSEFNDYAREISREDFKRLVKLPLSGSK